MEHSLVYSKCPVGLSEKQESYMVIKRPNYAICKTDNGIFKIDVRFKKEGKQYRTRETFKGGVREAERRAQALVQELMEKANSNLLTSNSSCSLKTFGECIDYYLKNTLVNTESTKPHLTVVQRYLSDVTVEDEDVFQRRYTAFIAEMRTTKSIRNTVYSPTTINHFTKRIDAVLNFCKRKKVISKTFSYDHDKFPQKPRKRIIENGELEALLAVIAEHRPYLLPIATYAFQIPSRKGELVKLRTEWVNLENLCIVIPSGVTKNDDECIKPIPPNMVEYFKSIPSESEFVFFRAEDGQYKPLGDFKKAWAHCKTLAGVTNLRFHDTRHHSATKLVLNGVSERVVMQVAGWKTNMLSTYYDNKSISASNAVFEALKTM